MVKSIFQEKREFLRYRYDSPVAYKVLSSVRTPNPASKVLDAAARNLSASGMLFSSKFLPEISSIIALDIDYRTSSVCREIEENALIVKNKLVGKVVRIEENANGVYGVGIAFIKRSEHLPEDLEKLIT